jgi:hypothetical protein
VGIEHIFGTLAGLALVFFLYQVIKNRGFRGAIFGAPVVRTIGELDLGRQGMVRTKLRVHRLETAEPSSPEIGIEVSTTTIGSFNIAPIRLSRSQAMALNTLISQAVAEEGR